MTAVNVGHVHPGKHLDRIQPVDARAGQAIEDQVEVAVGMEKHLDALPVVGVVDAGEPVEVVLLEPGRRHERA